MWEHRPLPGRTFFDLVGLFRTNALLAGNYVLSDKVARLEDVRAPVLALIAERDHIVPSASSHGLSRVEGLDVRVTAVDSGHVSMISGSTAQATTWPAIADWIRTHA